MSLSTEQIADIKSKIRSSYDDPITKDNIGRISFSQYSKFASCPKNWELSYGRGLRKMDPSIHTSFGTAFHETLQDFLSLYLSDNSEEALDIDLCSLLKDKMIESYKNDISNREGGHFSSVEELLEFWEDGCGIIEQFNYHKDIYFDPKRYELLGIEAPLFLKALGEEDYNVYMLSFLDIVLYDKVMNRVTIVDIKTSTAGWNFYMKKDVLKQSQLIFYKHFFSRNYNIDMEDIEIQFFIVKRKVSDKSPDRLESFVPSTERTLIREVVDSMETFVKTCFNPDGTYNLDREYLAIKGKNSKNCKYCEFKDQYDLCPKENRLVEPPKE